MNGRCSSRRRLLRRPSVRPLVAKGPPEGGSIKALAELRRAASIYTVDTKPRSRLYAVFNQQMGQ